MRLFEDYYPDYWFATDYWPLIPSAAVPTIDYARLNITASIIEYEVKVIITQNYNIQASISEYAVKANVMQRYNIQPSISQNYNIKAKAQSRTV